jgi:hypothetical protein
MSPASSDPSMLAVANLAPLRLTVLTGGTRQHANLLVSEQIVPDLVPLPC